MSEYLLIGTRGWEHDQWDGSFYDENLPADWRFAFFINLVRSVLVPAMTWSQVDAEQVAGWAEDCDAAFRFVLEMPPELSRPAPAPQTRQALADFERKIEPLRGLVAAFLLRVADDAMPEFAWLDDLLTAHGDGPPVCVDFPRQAWPRAETLALLQRHGASACWYPEFDSAPAPTGRFMVALMRDGGLRELRGAVEKLGAWMGEQRGAGLFFTDPAVATRLAQDSRHIAELMAV